MENINNYNDFITKISKLIIEKRNLEQDIIDTEKALEDRLIDYMTKKEFQDDIAYDKRTINEINKQLKDLIDYAISQNISLSDEITSVLKSGL